jgi:hypothetical protein
MQPQTEYATIQILGQHLQQVPIIPNARLLISFSEVIAFFENYDALKSDGKSVLNTNFTKS